MSRGRGRSWPTARSSTCPTAWGSRCPGSRRPGWGRGIAASQPREAGRRRAEKTEAAKGGRGASEVLEETWMPPLCPADAAPRKFQRGDFTKESRSLLCAPLVLRRQAMILLLMRARGYPVLTGIQAAPTKGAKVIDFTFDRLHGLAALWA